MFPHRVAARTLHVAITHAIAENAMMSPGLKVCPVGGALMICGEAELYVQRDGSMVRDTALEMGLPHGPEGYLAVRVDVYGSWPDNTWLVSTRVSEGPPFEIATWRWIGSRWVTAVPGRIAQRSVEAILPWGKAGAAIVEEALPPHWRQLRGAGAQSGANLQDFDAVAPFDGDTLVLATTRSEWFEADALRLWSVRSAVPVFATTVSETAGGADVVIRGIAQERPGGVSVFGARRSPTGGPTSAYVARFDGHSLVVLPAPPTEDVVAYVEERNGVAWALSSESDTPWLREPGGAWQTVPLPMPYKVDELSIAEDGTVWVRAHGPIVGKGAFRQVGSDVALFATRAFEHVLTLGGAPVPNGEGPPRGP